MNWSYRRVRIQMIQINVNVRGLLFQGWPFSVQTKKNFKSQIRSALIFVRRPMCTSDTKIIIHLACVRISKPSYYCVQSKLTTIYCLTIKKKKKCGNKNISNRQKKNCVSVCRSPLKVFISNDLLTDWRKQYAIHVNRIKHTKYGGRTQRMYRMYNVEKKIWSESKKIILFV